VGVPQRWQDGIGGAAVAQCPHGGAMPARRRCWGKMGGSGRAAVLAGQRRGVSGGEG
jgi:hypothetical protein